ncbi:DUF664 domain-containing protein [Nakamurella sp. YIM 132087]|uniref:DUF664 domain-containing protein n=1 Tax=Nakamurella alba TaxID=2665158 RepID=A0A7K1FQ12_9ACTN|nr:DUF664 domain-containing protein [Nakamurella alba]MTD16221.1 DUF664 domain-containing protein [Nakamurella alba]
MSSATDLLVDAFDRVQEVSRAAVADLDEQQLTARLDADANSIAWLVWHLTRVQDDHVSALAGQEQVWISGGWADRFALPFPLDGIGYGQSSADVAKVHDIPTDLLVGYQDEVHDMTVEYVGALSAADLAEVVDENWDPPVTAAVRLVSVVSDTLQHAGQAAFVRGILLRR